MSGKNSSVLKNERIAFIGLWLAALTFLFGFYGKVLLSPNSFLFSTSGDGIKNYFTYVQHAHSEEWIHSDAMNYPYGEHFLYLDCHPIFTWLLKLLANPFPGVLDYSVGIINTLMLFSFLISSLLLYRILRRFEVTALFAATSAIGIAVLSPQLFRMTGHYALSYSFFLPLTIYLYQGFRMNPGTWKWTISLFLTCLFWYFTHAYLGMIAVAALLLFWVFDAKRIWTIIRKGPTAVHFLLQTILPLLIFYVFVKLTDDHTGRTTDPYGFLVYTADWTSVFLPHHPPLNQITEQLVTPDPLLWEGWAYVGMGTVIVLILAIIGLFKTPKPLTSETAADQKPGFLLFSGVILLLFSFGIPFKWGLEGLLDVLPILKNFRGAGRFAWVFFYAATLFAAVYLDRRFLHQKGVAKYLVFLLPLSMVMEGCSYHLGNAEQITQKANLFQRDALPEGLQEAVNTIDPTQYQAIIPMPFFHIGSENVGKTASDESYKNAMLLGFHLDLPILGNYSTRTSIWESRNSMQAIAPTIYEKQIAEDIQDDRPFLVLVSPGDKNAEEELLIQRSELLLNAGGLGISTLSKQALFQGARGEELAKYSELQDTLVQRGNYYVMPNDSLLFTYFNDFEGNGLVGNLKDYTLIHSFAPGELPMGSYVASFWMQHDGENYGQGMLGGFAFVQTEDTSRNREWKHVTDPKNSFYISNDMTLVQMPLEVVDSTLSHAVYYKGDDRSELPIRIEDFLLQDVNSTVYVNQSKLLIQNNQRVYK